MNMLKRTSDSQPTEDVLRFLIQVLSKSSEYKHIEYEQ